MINQLRANRGSGGPGFRIKGRVRGLEKRAASNPGLMGEKSARPKLIICMQLCETREEGKLKQPAFANMQLELEY